MLVSDKGIRGVTVINRAKDVRFDESATPSVWAESGANFGTVARQVALRGLSVSGPGLENFKGFSKLVDLDLSESQADDAGLAAISAISVSSA